MILEIAQIDIRAGCEDAFERNAALAVALLKDAKGVGKIALRRSVEFPSRYTLLVEWESICCHVENFQKSEEFKEWRRLLSPYFERLPDVEHTVETLSVTK